MENIALRTAQDYSPYGSTVQKYAYMYGSLDNSRTTLSRNCGMARDVGAYVLAIILPRLGPEAEAGMRERILKDLRPFFPSHYTAKIGLDGFLDPDTISKIMQPSPGLKYPKSPSVIGFHQTLRQSIKFDRGTELAAFAIEGP